MRFLLALRQMKFDWHRDLSGMIRWAKEAGFEAIDLRDATAEDVHAVSSAGLKIGTVDLLEMGQIVHADPARRRELGERNAKYIREMAAAGVKTFLTVLVPDDPGRGRAENYRIAVEALGPLVDAARSCNARIAIEGWPGPAPFYPSIGCTPETCRALLRDTDPRVIGINYDPSHLIRLGIDPIRFLREFAPHIWHVHAKDTLILPEAQYEFGLYQDAAFAPPHRYGRHAWRYVIPGRGLANWRQILAILAEVRYPGPLSIELEDEDFLGTAAEGKAGLMEALEFLRALQE